MKLPEWVKPKTADRNAYNAIYEYERELSHWLQGYRPAISTAIAARAALRTLPCFGFVLGKYDFGSRGLGVKEIAQPVILPTFRAISTTWVAAFYPNYRAKICATGKALFYAAMKASNFDPLSIGDDRDPHTIMPSITAALAAATIDPNLTPFGPSGHAAAAVARAAERDPTVSHVTRMSSSFFKASLDDTEIIKKNNSEMELAGQPLWLDGCPSNLMEPWEDFKQKLLADDDDWLIWTTWYEARLLGQLESETIGAAPAMVPEEVWVKGPRAVNFHLQSSVQQELSKATIL